MNKEDLTKYVFFQLLPRLPLFTFENDQANKDAFNSDEYINSFINIHNNNFKCA